MCASATSSGSRIGPGGSAINPHLALLLSPVYTGALAPAHREDLAKSGLTPETIAAQRIMSIPPNMIGRLLGFDIKDITSAMLLPYPDPAGGFMDHIRLKIFPPVITDTGTIKYLQPKRSAPRLYFVQRVLELVQQTTEPLWLIEGEKKAAAVAQLGLPAVGFAGAEGWHTRGSRELLEDFAGLKLMGRAVHVVPDGDFQSNANVSRAMHHLGTALRRRGAEPTVVVLPTE
jgi:Domain of unknown function (DUF3854)